MGRKKPKRKLRKFSWWEFPGSPVIKTFDFPMQGAQVQSLVGELRSCLPCGMAKKKKKKEMLETNTTITEVRMPLMDSLADWTWLRKDLSLRIYQ